MKFLIDECLSPELVRQAQNAGFGESSHVTWLGRSGAKDWELMPLILGSDGTFVTKNSIDFRGPPKRPGSKGQYHDVAIHAGLVCLNGPPAMDLDIQLELFETVLAEVTRDPDLINQVLEMTLEDDEIRILRYALPREF